MDPEAPALLIGDAVRALTPIEAALLALPVLQPALSRRQLAELVWPHAADALNSLRQTHHKLKKLVGSEVLGVDGDAPVLRLPHDLTAAEAAWRADPAALPGELLGRLQWHEPPALVELIEQARSRWRSRRTTAMSRLATEHESADRLDAATVCRQRLCEADPLDQAHHEALISLQVRQGRPDDALAVVQALRQRLTRARCKPSPALLTLQRQLQATLQARSASALRALLPPRTVGREALLAELASARAAQRSVLLMGVAGIGKTRLMGEAMPKADGLTVRLRPSDRDTPHAVATRTARLLVERGGPPAVDALSPADRAQLARLLPELGTPGRASMPALQRALLAWLTQAQVSVLGIDDLHCADDASVALLSEMVAAPGAPWCVLAAREGEASPALQRWLSRGDAALQSMPVPPLADADVARLLESMRLPGVDSTALHRHSGGNPLFLLETLRLLCADGRDHPLPRTGALPVPARVNELLLRRLQGLPGDALQLAQLAALADEDLDATLASSLLHVPTLSLAATWRALESAQVLREQSFTHELLREAALEGVPDAVARAMHERIAEHLAQRNGRAGIHREAAHWQAATRWGAAGAAFSEAALHSRSVRRRDDEARWWRHAVAAFTKAGDAAALTDAQAQSIEAVLVTEGVDAALSLAQRVLDAPAPPAARATATLGRLKALLLSAQFATGKSEAQAALALIERAGTRQELLMTRFLMAQAGAALGQADAQWRVLDGLATDVAAIGDEEFDYEYVAACSYVLGLTNQIARAQQLLQRMVSLSQRLGDAQEQLTSLSNYALNCVELGQLAEGHAAAVRASQLRTQLGDVNSIAASVGDMHLGVSAAALGRLHEGLAALARARDCFECAQAPAWQRLAELNLALLHLQCGQLGRARHLLGGDWSAATPIHRAGRWMLLARLARWQRRPADDCVIEAEKEARAAGRAAAMPLWAIEASWHERAEPAASRLRDARSALIIQEQLAHAHLAHGALVARLLEFDEHAAVSEAAACWQAEATCRSGDSPIIWAACARAFAQGGDRARLAEVLAAFRQWLDLALAPPMEPLFAATLVERNPDVRTLLALARDNGAITPAP